MYLGCPVIEWMFLMSPFQLSLFCDSVNVLKFNISLESELEISMSSETMTSYLYYFYLNIVLYNS